MDPFFVPTRSSVGKSSDHQLVTFNSYQRSMPSKNNEIQKQESSQSIEMKKTRFEIYKFAQKALHGEERNKNKIQLAIKLGAKPPKNTYKNYKNLKEEIKKELEEAEKKKELYNISVKHRVSMHKSKLNKGALKRKRKIGSGILNMYGKVTKKVKAK
ncbi:uncharacterized protein C1orf131 homolog [Halyomorpha halys]|uniref:uncharacterized protein C1orf131 homolog n=1 Tax=Halyomorpha halys TaxID=286706 RepID=UPI0006D51407|nr:uncharacterized protein C1orf131 homolog [Halyomorpha halys]